MDPGVEASASGPGPVPVPGGRRLYLDTETIGFHGLCVLMQYAWDDGEVELCRTFEVLVGEVRRVIESFVESGVIVVGFNLEFDWFHIVKLYNIVRVLESQLGSHVRISDNIDLVLELEQSQVPGQGARGEACAWCVKPWGAMDVMVAARNGKWQTLMDRGSIMIRRVPKVLGAVVAEWLGREVRLDDVYFAKAADPSRRWVIRDAYVDGKVSGELVNLELVFAPDGGLKSLAVAELGVGAGDVEVYDSVACPKPEGEVGWAPYGLHSGASKGWGNRLIWQKHVAHWTHGGAGVRYAVNDIVFTRGLCGRLVIDSDWDPGSRVRVNSELACLIGAVRWKGYAVDVPRLRALIVEREAEADRESQITILGSVERVNFNSGHVALTYLRAAMTEAELAVLRDPATGKLGCDKVVLGMIAQWPARGREEVCSVCGGGSVEACTACGGSGLVLVPGAEGEVHPAAERAARIIKAREAKREAAELQKLVSAGRFHANFKVMGALSGRMSGDGGQNAQGISRREAVRKCFPLADAGYRLEGGDFSGFEITISLAVYRDPLLLEDVNTRRACKQCWVQGQAVTGPRPGCEACKGSGVGTKIHALLGQYLFDKDYDTILASEDLYPRAKQGTFALLYGGEEHTLSARVGIPEEVGIVAYKRWCERYTVWGAARARLGEQFQTLVQAQAGGRVTYKRAADWVETLFGYRRWFVLENDVVSALVKLASSVPEAWSREIGPKVTVTRRVERGPQSVVGAVRSACYGAAFSIQGAAFRAAANHAIQGTGAEACKRLQHAIWGVQPSGVLGWKVIPMNVHDEVQCPIVDDGGVTSEAVRSAREAYVKGLGEGVIPGVELEWVSSMETWADK